MENSSFYLKSQFFLSNSNHLLSAGHDARKFAQSNPVSPHSPYNKVPYYGEFELLKGIQNFVAQFFVKMRTFQ